MTMRKDPLDDLLFQIRARDAFEPEIHRRSESIAHGGLQKLSAALDNPSPKGMNYYNAMGFEYFSFGFQKSDVPQAESLYHRIHATLGTGSTHAQEKVLDFIARTADPASIPFWVGLLDLTRPRDTFTSARKTMAVAALAYLAIYYNSRETYAGLRELLKHSKPEVRALALYYLSRIHEVLKRSLSPGVLRDIEQIAEHDPAFAPRFQARALLRDNKQPVPLDNPDGVYTFKVKFRRAKSLLQRTIPLLSKQTLDDLAHVFNSSINWDMDHLYSFYLNGELYDEQYGFTCPYEDGHLPRTDEGVIGELGLTLKHKFVYYFDYGDSQQCFSAFHPRHLRCANLALLRPIPPEP